jgi:hypothetical protein
MAERLGAGERARIAATIENPLNPGRYSIEFWICRNRNVNDLVMPVSPVVDFVVYGSVWAAGIVSLDAEIEALAVQETE